MRYSKNALLVTLALSVIHMVVCNKANVRHQVKTSVPNADAVPGFLKLNKGRLLAFSPSIQGHEESGNLRSLQGERLGTLPPPCAIRGVKVSNDGQFVHMVEVQAFATVEGEEKNVALATSGAKATQSGTWENETNYGAGIAIDGITKPPDIFEWRGGISCNTAGTPSFWQVDFGGLYEVKRVVIWNRPDKNNKGRLLGAKVELLDAKLNVVRSQIIDKLLNGTIPLDFDGDCDPEDWSINFNNVTANFSLGSEEELVLKYDIGKYRQYNHTLLQSDCNTPITDIDINITATNQTISGSKTQSLLILSNSINKTNIANSSIWNATSSQIELCQKVQLYLPSAGSNQEAFVIAEDIREIDIDFDLSANFSITGNLDQATINGASSNTTVASYIGACQCNGVSFNCIKTPSNLVPNTELIVCIYSTSSDVLIKALDSMIIKQKSPSTNSLNVITKGGIVVKSITSMKSEAGVNDAGGNGVRITTRVPTNMFDYKTAGTKIIISGEATMELAGSNTTGRKLVADVAAISGGNEGASFELEVSLQQQLDSQEDPVSSAASIAKNGYIVLGSMAFALVYAMW